jgi:hypothetical protein
MKYDNVEMLESGLKCDNPQCDWTDMSITFDNYKDWINCSCPKCGENVLTQSDYENAEQLRLMHEFLNSIPPKELEELTKSIDKEALKERLKERGVSGVELMDDPNRKVIISVDTHKKITITSIRPTED